MLLVELAVDSSYLGTASRALCLMTSFWIFLLFAPQGCSVLEKTPPMFAKGNIGVGRTKSCMDKLGTVVVLDGVDDNEEEADNDVKDVDDVEDEILEL